MKLEIHKLLKPSVVRGLFQLSSYWPKFHPVKSPCCQNQNHCHQIFFFFEVIHLSYNNGRNKDQSIGSTHFWNQLKGHSKIVAIHKFQLSVTQTEINSRSKTQYDINSKQTSQL